MVWSSGAEESGHHCHGYAALYLEQLVGITICEIAHEMAWF